MNSHPQRILPPRPHHSSQAHNDPSFVHVLYDSTMQSHSFNSPRTGPPMLSYISHNDHATSHMYTSWQNQVHALPSNPYPSPPPPPPIPHKVWILDCRSCGAFLTNRGMKAVLLLRPNVSLFSSDALPINCSADSESPEVLCIPSSSANAPRTCECLTQSLCCHGCGNSIGYMIVIPCSRCTSSISATNRATNGHRFVFHSNEIIGTERHYVPGEPGIIPSDESMSEASPDPPMQPQMIHHYTPSAPLPHVLPTRAQSHISPPIEYLPTPPLEFADISPLSSASPSPTVTSFPFPGSRTHNNSYEYTEPSQHHARPLPHHVYHHTYGSHAYPRSPPVPVPSQSYLSRRPNSSQSSRSSQSSPPPLMTASVSSSPTLEHRDREQRGEYGMPVEPKARKLKAGDVLYWHHLSKHGEIPGVMEVKAARKHTLLTKPNMMHFDR